MRSRGRRVTWYPTIGVHVHARTRLPFLTVALLVATACAEGPPEEEAPVVYDDPQLVFWSALQDLCGQAFEGRVVESVPPDDSFEGQRLLMHVRTCDAAEVRIPFMVGDDRSRTWVVTTTAVGLRLKHDHRHEDGTEDDVTQYGGDTDGRGTATLQEFPADPLTGELVPAAATNVWFLSLEPGLTFAYGLRRGGSDRRFRVEFDLTNPVTDPPPPWGG